MGSFFQVLKTLTIACLLVALMQIKINGDTIENHSIQWLKHSTTASYVRSAASGGALAIRNFFYSAKINSSKFVHQFKNEHLDEQARK